MKFAQVKEAARRFAAYARREAHHVQAVAYVVGAVAYQVVVGAGGFDAVRKWSWREWVGHGVVTGGPALLFLLRGRHSPATDPDAAAAVDAVQKRTVS